MDCEHIKCGGTVKTLLTKDKMTSCLSKTILLFSLVIEMQVMAARCLHFPASLIVTCGHMIKFLQIKGGHNWWMALLFLLPLLSSWTNCDPVSTIRRVDGKTSHKMAEGEERNLGFHMTKWVELPTNLSLSSNCYMSRKSTSIFFTPLNFWGAHCYSSHASPDVTTAFLEPSKVSGTEQGLNMYFLSNQLNCWVTNINICLFH